MALFESYERRIDKINGVLAQYGIGSVEECRELCKAKGFDPYEIVKGIQPICFENACWAYTVGAAIALKSGVKTAADAARKIGEGLQSFCIDGSVAEDRKVGLGHGNLGAMLLSDESKCFAFLAGHESFAAAENGAVWPVPDRETIREVVPDQVFPTPSGRMELYYDSLVDFGQELPQWESCEEIANEELRARFPLQLTNTRTRFRIHNQFYDSDWLQLLYQPLIALNPTDMESRGLVTGDIVKVYNDRGSFKVYVAANSAIRSGSARIYEAATGDYTVEGNL